MRIYFSGVGGVGIGPAALLAKDLGYDVLGSDLDDNQVAKSLEAAGVEVFIGQSGKEIAEAHETLSDKTKKAKYDQFGHNAPRGSNPFGGGGFRTHQPRRRPRGENKIIVLKLTLDEIHSGVKKHYKYVRKTSCGPCLGMGGSNRTACTT